MPKFEPCFGATSDHAWRSISISIFSGIQLQGATWNMQMRCVSKKHAMERAIQNNYDLRTAHSNNPMDITETDDDYLNRKRQQIDELQTIISSGNHFVFLQEADWVKFDALKNHYLDFLDRNHWAMIETPACVKGQQPLVTLYDTRKLRPVPNSGKGMFRGSYNFRGYRHDFIDISSGKRIALVNLHLEYGRDYRQEMLDAQFDLVRENIPSIMGGDTNNVQHLNLQTMVGSWHHATNIASNGRGGFTTLHESNGSYESAIQKAYDGFFVAPDQNSFAQIEEKPGKYFEDLGEGVVAYKDYIPAREHAIHQTLIGRPWQRFKDILLEYDVALGRTVDPVVQTKLREKMNNIGNVYLGKTTWAEFSPTLPVYSGKVASSFSLQVSASSLFVRVDDLEKDSSPLLSGKRLG